MKLKIVFAQDIATTTVPAKLKIESQWISVLALMQTFIQCTVVQGATNGCTMYIETPYIVQAARESDDSTAAVMTVIDDKTETFITNFQEAVISTFTKGVNYLLKYSDGVLLNMIPPRVAVPMQQSSTLQDAQVGNNLSATHYHFFAHADTTPLGGATPTAWTFQMDARAAAGFAAKKAAAAEARFKSELMLS